MAEGNRRLLNNGRIIVWIVFLKSILTFDQKFRWLRNCSCLDYFLWCNLLMLDGIYFTCGFLLVSLLVVLLRKVLAAYIAADLVASCFKRSSHQATVNDCWCCQLLVAGAVVSLQSTADDANAYCLPTCYFSCFVWCCSFSFSASVVARANTGWH